jgi:hypothetical protein
MSTNYRVYRIDLISSGSATILMNQTVADNNSVGYNSETGAPQQSATVQLNSTGSTGQRLDNVWGIMKGEANCSGSLILEGGGTLNLASIDNHQIFPCYPKSLIVSSGSLYILS